jgi:putative membrane protein
MSQPVDPDAASVELSSNRTAMSFERTMMSTDRTLMSAARTSISLIGFGFTIFQFFHALNDKFLNSQLPPEAPRRFGGSLILLGIILLVMALWFHRQEVTALRSRRQRLFEDGLIHQPAVHRTSAAVSISVLMLIVGALAMWSVATHSGIF